ncbi:MAG TPA: flagellar hook-associated protein FlgK [Bacteroidota bacterium]|nr:flagellar hook-associated protein FlgK [Bacteroidota bacterium]
MSGLSLILETARRALQAQQVGLGVTSHNIANATTPGYSRQRAGFVPTDPLPQPYGLLGTGVTIAAVQRLRDEFIDAQTRDVGQSMSRSTMENQILTQVQSSFNEPSDTALSGTLAQFFNGWQDLSVNPEDSSSRNAVLQRGVLLADSFHSLSGELTQLRTSLADDVTAKVTKINTLTSELSKLDLQITNARALGQDPNDAMDQRDEKLQELSGLIKINVSYDTRGSMTVATGGTVIASGAGSLDLVSSVSGNQIVVNTSLGGPNLPVTGGELGGTMDMYNTSIPNTLAQLDQAAGALIARINQLHQAGYGLGTPPPTGTAFFTGTTAADINVNAAVMADTNLIAASSDGTPGSNVNALALAGVQTEKLLGGNAQSVGDFYNGIVSALGSAVDSSNNTMKQQQSVLTGLTNQQDSIAGVSIDEEMTNMITYQKGYAAAAKLVTAVNTMFDTILQMV